MKQVGVYEAKTQFSALIKEAARGERIVITHRGEPVAELVPAHRESEGLIDRLLANETPLGVPSREAIEDGRR
jgi:prevent-host-death family protein